MLPMKVLIWKSSGNREGGGDISIGIDRTLHGSLEFPAHCNLHALHFSNLHERHDQPPPLRLLLAHDGDQELEAMFGVQEAG